MIQYPGFDPIAIAIGPVKVHWYGITYLGGFAAAWWLGRRQQAMASRESTAAAPAPGV